MTRAETIASTVVGACVATMLASGAAFLVTRSEPWMILAVVSMLLLLPVGGAAQAFGTRAWRPLATSATVIAGLGAAAILASIAQTDFGLPLLAGFAVSAFPNGWFANYLIVEYQ